MLRFLLISCLLLPTHTSWAQIDPPPAFPRWYAGMQYGRQDYQLAFSATAGSTSLGPGRTNTRRLQLTLGYQIKPRLAVQIGIAPADETFSYGGSGTNSAGKSLTEWGVSTNSSLALPILVRYTLAPKLWKNLHLDVLAGTVLFGSEGKSDFTRTEDGVITTHSIATTRVRNAFLAVGPSIRYEFGRHLAGFADGLFYKNLESSSTVFPGSNLGNKTGITTATNLGIRYRFGYR